MQAVSLLQLLLHPRFHDHMLLQLAALVLYFSCPWQNILPSLALQFWCFALNMFSSISGLKQPRQIAALAMAPFLRKKDQAQEKKM